MKHLLLLCLALASLDANARLTSSPKVYASEKTRDIVGDRKALIVIPQNYLMSTTDDWDLRGLPLFGWAPYLIAGSVARADGSLQTREEAEAQIASLREALIDYDFDTPMVAALTPTLQGSNWVRARDIESTHAGDAASIELALNESNTRQMLTVHARYYADHKYRNLVVSVEPAILVRKIPKGEYGDARLKKAYIPFRQVFRCIVYLPDSENGGRAENLARWTANNGELARRALDLGIRHASQMLAQNLDGTEQSTEAWAKRGDRKTVTRSRMLGWVVERGEDYLVFFAPRDDALNYIITLRP